MNRTSIGQMQHRVTVEKPIHRMDSQGGYVDTWEPVCTVWAQIQPLEGRELIEAMQVVWHVSHKIYMRYNPLIDAGYRIRYGDRVFNIVAIIDTDMQHKELEVLVDEQL